MLVVIVTVKGNIITSEEYPEDILEDISVYSDELEIDESIWRIYVYFR